jgi:hypothetical protein
VYLALHNLFSMMDLAKHPFAILRKNYNDPNHTCSWLFNKQLLVFSAEYQPLMDDFGGVVLWLVCCFYLVSCGLLLACPSPPSSAAGSLPFFSWMTSCPAPPGTAAVCLTFSSWDGLELQYSMVLLGVILMELWCCGRTCEVLVMIQCWSCAARL